MRGEKGEIQLFSKYLGAARSVFCGIHPAIGDLRCCQRRPAIRSIAHSIRTFVSSGIIVRLGQPACRDSAVVFGQVIDLNAAEENQMRISDSIEDDSRRMRRRSARQSSIQTNQSERTLEATLFCIPPVTDYHAHVYNRSRWEEQAKNNRTAISRARRF